MKIFKKEKEVTELALQHLEASEECVRTCGEAFESYLDGRLKEAETLRFRTSELETKADELRRQIGDRLYLGAYLPLLRGDIYSLVESLDSVPNAAESFATFLLSQRPAIPEEFRDSLRKVAAASFEIVEPLHQAVKAFFNPKGSIDDIRQHHRAVGVQESVVDQLEWEFTIVLYNSSLELASKHHIKQALERMVEISDRAEDVADQLELVALKSVL